MDNVIAITMDMDWVHDKVLEYSLDLLDSYNIQATLFMTNSTKVDLSEHEIAIHPNFTSFDLERHIKERLDDFPDAKGSRSHSLFFTERLRPIYARFGITYQSNYMMYRQNSIKPLRISPVTLEFPLYWMDNFYMEMEESPCFTIEELNLGQKGLKIFCFHPMHVFLNTERLERYEDAKRFYKNMKALHKMRNTKVRGIKDIFLDILSYIKTNHIPNKVLSDIKDIFLNENK